MKSSHVCCNEARTCVPCPGVRVRQGVAVVTARGSMRWWWGQDRLFYPQGLSCLGVQLRLGGIIFCLLTEVTVFPYLLGYRGLGEVAIFPRLKVVVSRHHPDYLEKFNLSGDELGTNDQLFLLL